MAQGHFSIELGPLGPREIEKARIELRETPEIVVRELANLRALVQGEPGFNFDESDAILIAFLRPCHWYSESAFALIKNFCEFRAKRLSILANLDIRTEEQYFKSNVINVLPNRDQEGRRIILLHYGEKWDPSIVSVDHIFRMVFMATIASTAEPITQVNGAVIVSDAKGMGLKQIRGLSPTFASHFTTLIQQALPVRVKAIHIINAPRLFKMAFAVFKHFIQEKLGNRIHFHGYEMESLHRYISPECLPENFGGYLPEIDLSGENYLYPALLSVEKDIKAWEKYGYEKDLK